MTDRSARRTRRPNAGDAAGAAVSAAEAHARNHGGVICRADAIEVGMSKAQVDRRVRHGHWVSSPVRGVYLIANAANDPVAHLTAATQFSGGLAYRRSALGLWGLVDHPSKPEILLGRYLQSPAINVTVRRSAIDMAQTRRSGVATVPLEFALASLAAIEPVSAVHRMIDEALRRQLTTHKRVIHAIRVTAGTSQRRVAALRSILAERDRAAAVPLSAWSRDVADRLCANGLERPEMEWRVQDRRGHFVAQVDLAYPNIYYAIELDSVAFHLDRQAFERDRRRDIDLAGLGWHVDRFTWAMCANDWPWVVATVKERLHHRAG